MARPPTRKLGARSWARSRLTQGRRLQLLRPMKSANATGSVWNSCVAGKNDEAARFAGELGCERLRPQLLGLLEGLGYAAPAPAARAPIPSVKLGSALRAQSGGRPYLR